MAIPSYVGRYEVRQEIARGGFAVVVQAWDEELQSLVALKVLHRELANDEEIQTRFVEEARLLRRIRSPHVVTVHDVGRLDDGRPYFVMDYADRGTLAPRLERKPGRPASDPQSVMLLVDAVADGLSAIHEAGVVHRDIKPANILLQLARRGSSEDPGASAGATGREALLRTDERILVGDLGIAKDVLKHGGLVTLVGGTPLYRAPEQNDDAAEITPAADVYAATALLWHVLAGKRPPDASGVIARLATLPAVWQEVIEQGMAMDPRARFTCMEEWRVAIHGALAQEAAAPDDQPTELLEPTVACPYKGLAAYQPEDARRFFGRETLIDDLARRLRLQKVLVVGGPSGSGKSSLVRAGLIPALRAGAVPGSDRWRIALLTPGRDPLAELYFQVTRTLPSGRPSVLLEDVLARPTMARHLGEGNGAEQPLMLCIDQFEELFTLAPPGHRDKLVTALSAMTDPADSRIRVVIAIRADFYAACAQLPWLAERITANQVLVGPMTESELRRAISEPARRAGLFLERGLADAIIKEAGSEAGSLPLVAHALVETWLRRQGNALTLDGFTAAGGVAGAISQTADATFEHRFNPIEQQATKRLFLRLVTPGEGTADTRRLLAWSEIGHDSDPEVMHRVVESLTEARLLTVDAGTVQIAHEALLRTWPRLRAWIDDCRDDLRTRQRISHAAAEWNHAGRDPDLLYRGTPLLSALDWAATNPDQPGVLERAFLEASTEARAKAEAISVDRERRARKVRRTAIAFLTLLATGATVASVAAFMAFREARQSEETAKLATAEARERFAGALGAIAHGLVESDPLLALPLAAEAVARAQSDVPGFDARAAMIEARRMLARGDPVIVGSPIAAGDALAIAVSPDGTLVATGQRNGSIDLIDTATRERVGPSLRGHRGGVENLDFAPDSRSLASVGDDGTLRLWTIDAGLGRKAWQAKVMDDVVWGVRFDPSGAMLASAGEDGTIRLWDAARGVPLGGRWSISKATAVAFTPDGHGLVAGNGRGEVYGWAVPSGTPVFEPVRNAHSSDVWKLAFSPTGDRFATASSDGTSVVLQYPTGRIVGRAFGDASGIAAVLFTPDGKTLLGGGADGAVRLWDLDHQKLLMTTPSGHTQPIADAGMSRDGKLLATLGKDQLIRLWSVGMPRPLSEVRKVAGQMAKGVAFSRDGKRMAAGDDTGAVEVWPLGSGGEPMALLGHKQQVWALAFSPDGSLMASGDRGGQVNLWNLADGTLRRSIAADEGPIWSLAFTPDGRTLVTASDRRVQSWDAATGTLRHALPNPSGSITRATLSPDGSLVATASSDGRVRLWDLGKATLVKELVVDDDVVWSVAFSPDGRDLATGTSDEVVAVWDIASGRQLMALTGHAGGATDVAYLADGVTLVAVDRRGQLHLWDAASGRRLAAAWQGHTGASWRIAVHPDGEQFATTGDDGRVMIWDELSVAHACDLGRAAFDAMRRSQYLGEGERSVACDRAP